MNAGSEETSSRDDATLDLTGAPRPVQTATRLVQVLDGYMADLQAGRAPDKGRLLAEHPELAAELESCLAGIDFIQRAVGDPGGEPARLGDFRIIREVGRGGMGVVYEAEQVTLHRTVALKVLRYGALADETALLRFHREAETVAQLHHTNIVPIHAVGTEGGVHYYAMQFIEGRSLAELLAEASAGGRCLPPSDIADWARQAAEALAYAHRRGVIHRDIKPSNLLLDASGIVWLTDFGLAKRGGEASLTVTGAFMGTPRYMSPEQAESLTRPVDHRTDIYSLGASLYELATGRPAFDADTPHAVIAKIIGEEPVAPRLIRPGLPRDLETVILTCLAKDPPRRYPTADAVADDLRAYLDARPIRARRTSMIVRAVRLARKNRRSIAAASIAFVISALLVVAGFLGWRWYDQSITGRLTLGTDGTALTAEILQDDRDEPAAEEFTAPNRAPLSLPEGTYRVRLAAPGQLSETFRLSVERGWTRSFSVRLDDRRLWGPEAPPPAPVAEAVELAGQADLIEWDGKTLRRRGGRDGKVIWDLGPGRRTGWPDGPVFDRWMGWLEWGDNQTPPSRLTRPAPDLDGDGTRDLVFAFKSVPAMLAVSGKDGRRLWVNPLSGPGDEPPPRPGYVFGPQPVQADSDGDGVSDLFAVFSTTDDQDRTKEERSIRAVSGRSGRTLWSHDLGVGAVRSDIALFRMDGRLVLAVAHGSHWLGLDLATGRAAAGPLDLTAPPVRAPQYADCDADGRPDVIAVAAGEDASEEILSVYSPAKGGALWTATIRARAGAEPVPWQPPAPCPLIADLDGDGRPELIVPSVGPLHEKTVGVRMLDGATGKQRWIHDTNVAIDALTADRTLDAPDLDGDGVREVFLASIALGDSRLDTYLGTVVSEFRIYVDALSGRDGHALWWWKDDFRCHANNSSLDPLATWAAGPDGWPQFLVSYGEYWQPHTLSVLEASTGRAIHTLRGISRPGVADLDGDGMPDLWGTVDGKVQAIRGAPPAAWRWLGHCRAAGDLDGDGTDDALRLDPRSSEVRAVSGRDGRILWQADADPGGRGQNAADLNHSTAATLPLPAGDLDGDGTPDVLVSRYSESWGFTRPPGALPLVAISGRKGVRLWDAGVVPPADADATFQSNLIWGLDARDLGAARGPALTVLIYTSPTVVPTHPAYWWQLRLARISARDGAITWVRPLTERIGAPFQRNYTRDSVGAEWRIPEDTAIVPNKNPFGGYGPEIAGTELTFPHQFADLDGDGIPELVLAVPTLVTADTFAYDLQAVSLGDGRPVWHRLLRRLFGERGKDRRAPAFVAGDLDGDRKAEVVLIDVPAHGKGVEVAALDGGDGRPRWTWLGGDNRDHAEPESIPIRLVAPDGRGHRSVALVVGKGEIVLLDEGGRVRMRHRMEPPAGGLAFRGHDLDGDGRDELLIEAKDKVVALRAGAQGALWERPAAGGVRQVWPAGPGHGAIVVVGEALGLDGRDGHPRWTGGPGRALAFLGTDDTRDRPLILSALGDATVCRRPLPTGPEGRLLASSGRARSYPPPAGDPRLIQPFRWEAVYGRGNPFLNPWWSFAAVALCLVTVVAPEILVRRAIRRRRRGLTLLLTLPVIVAIVLAAFRLWTAYAPSLLTFTPLGPARVVTFLTTIAYGFLAVVFVRQVWASAARRRWWALGAVLVIFLLRFWLTAVILVGGELTPSEDLQWNRWYLIALEAAYGTGAIIIAWKILAVLVRGLWRVLRSIIARIRPKPPRRPAQEPVPL
jgi:tRNA A-37 threonylcarbamoyl transferase component Bud32